MVARRVLQHPAGHEARKGKRARLRAGIGKGTAVLCRNRVALTLTVGIGAFGLIGASAEASVTPGWECIPTTAGKGVVSGGTGSAPSCGSGTTAVLAPTYVASGVGAKPTVQFAAVNVQIVSGSGSTSGGANGEGNLVVGYAENPDNRPRTGSNDLVVGTDNGWTSYGDLVGGSSDRTTGPYATAFGLGNVASGAESVAAGRANVAAGAQASALGGQNNRANDGWSSVVGGCNNVAGAGAVPSASCPSPAEAILGGASNDATGGQATVSGGQLNTASGSISTVSAGYINTAGGLGASVSGGYGNTSTGNDSSISGGGKNSSTGAVASIAGGYFNTATVDEASVLGGCSNVAGKGTATVNSGCTSFGDSFTTVVGGIGNQDTPLGSAILGGEENSINAGQGGAVAGGHNIGLEGISNDITVVGSQLFNP